MSALSERLLADPAIEAIRAALDAGGLIGSPAEGPWVVGGTVRDAALRRPIHDVDLVVAGDAEAAARVVARLTGGAVFPLSEEFRSWRALDREAGWLCDVTARRGPTIEADLCDRDFTVNAMAVPLAGGDPIDPHGGLSDLDRGILRVLGGPELERSAYAADALRPLRLVRLATELPLEPEPATARLTQQAAPRVTDVSPERVFAELRRIVTADRAVEGVALADRLGLLAAVLPEVEALRGVEQSHFHHLDALEHTFEVLEREIELEGRLEETFGDEDGGRLTRVLGEPLADELTRGQALRFGALLHDVGKAVTRGVRPDGRVTFLGHDRVGADMVRSVCRRLRTSERLGTFLAALTERHLVLGFLVHDRPLDRRAVYRYLRACEPVEVEVTLLSCADRLATRGRLHEPAIAVHLELARELMHEALAWREAGGAPRPPLRGDELAAALGIEPGPELGRLLEALSEARFAGEARDPGQAIELARHLRDNLAS